MSFFEEDSFEDIVRGLFGDSQRRQPSEENFISGEEEDRNIDFVEGKKDIFVIFELPGYSKEDIELNINDDDLKIIASKKSSAYIESYLAKRFNEGVIINKILPRSLKTKKYEYTMKNGILELVFKK